MPTSGPPHRYKALWPIVGAAVLIVVGGAVAGVFLLSGAYSTAATKQHFRVTYRFLEAGLRYSVNSYADEIDVPDLEQVANIPQGQACYRTHCVQCHGAPGISREGLGMGQLPGPSSLAQTGREWPPEHLFYVTQKGVRMSGMPAWEYRISEDALWSTVAFVQAMSFMTRRDYERSSEQSEGIDCPQPQNPVEYSEDNAHTLFRQYACDTCHQIDRMVGPKTFNGPPLQSLHRRKYIAGVLPNTRENLVRWLIDPQAVSPETLMPDAGVTEQHAQVMAQYLLGFQ